MGRRVNALVGRTPIVSSARPGNELAGAVGISNGSAHYLLTALLDKGLIKLGNFTAAQDKRRYAYILTPKGIAEKAAITKRFLERKIQEYDALKAEIEALRDELGDDVVPENSPGS